MLRGATFDNQIVKAKYDGALFGYQYGDGSLLGCTISNTATTITIQEGILLVGGRIIANDGALAINLIDPITNGYFRVILQIDLNKTATQTEFEQVEILQQYKATIAEFAALTQEDINGTGKIYQMEIGIYEISSQQIVTVVSTFGAVETKADEAMPKAGGTFTGRVNAQSANFLGDGLRNSNVKDAGGTNVSRQSLNFYEE
ncbi:MAG: hypothetical protein GX928_02545 [Ruminococcaceae bacterium]|nr:hypothetical protein [Oscillospiraceae bacterium]